MDFFFKYFLKNNCPDFQRSQKWAQKIRKKTKKGKTRKRTLLTKNIKKRIRRRKYVKNNVICPFVRIQQTNHAQNAKKCCVMIVYSVFCRFALIAKILLKNVLFADSRSDCRILRILIVANSATLNIC